MKVFVDVDAVELLEAEDCTSFHVEVRGDADVAAVLDASGAGTLAEDGEHALIEIGWVRQHASGVGPQWEQDFDAMIDYARGQGWIDEADSSIVAHLERS